MKISRIAFDILFILTAAIFIIVLIQFDLIEKYIGFGLIPILLAYFIGQYSGRKYKNVDSVEKK